MKTTKILTILLVLMISSLFSFAQNITADTTLANKHFKKAKAEIFANQAETLSGFQTLTELCSQKLSLRHYQACDTLISQVRKEMKGNMLIHVIIIALCVRFSA